MTTKITCPVCDHPEIEGNICPNCETELSLIRMLVELPAASETQPTVLLKPWLPAIFILLVIVGISLGYTGSFLLSQQQPPQQQSMLTSSSPTVSSPTPQETAQPTNQSENKLCGNGFYYTVRSGDSLSLIASNFYGNQEDFLLITQANPKLQGRENYLNIGEILLIPNLKEYSCGRL